MMEPRDYQKSSYDARRKVPMRMRGGLYEARFLDVEERMLEKSGKPAMLVQ